MHHRRGTDCEANPIFYACRMPRLLIINDTLDHGNWGSQACAEGLRQILRAEVPNAELDIVPSKWIGQRYRFDPHYKGKRIFKKPGALNRHLFAEHQVLPEVADEFETVADLWQQGRGGKGAAEFEAKLRGVDAVVFNAEGSTYRVNFTAIKSLYLLWLAKTRYGLPSFFLNGSVTLTDVEAVLPGMVRKVFTSIDAATVREPNSLRIVRDWVPDADVKLVPDSVFHLGLPAAGAESPAHAWLRSELGDAPYFCFSLSMLPSDLRRWRGASATCELIRRLKERVPNAVLMARDRKDQYLRQVAEETGSLFLGKRFSYEDVMTVVGGAAFLWSGRYHHIIMATMMGTPSIPMMSTSPKVQGLCQLLGDVIVPPFDPTDLRPHLDAATQAVDQALSGGEALRERLRKRAEQLRPQTALMGQLVNEGLR
ncbi:MAG: polysaccharide pyruvyl transferase family protein [Myxococcales bacterium]|nr:polysaccharide pyruvyl transferase family protein [Myxococcales bacterium]